MKTLTLLALIVLLAPCSIFAAAEIADGKVPFSIKAPKAAEVRLKGQWSKDDFLLERNDTLIDALKAANVTREWHETAGDHSWPVWRTYLSAFVPRLFQP
jgi:enterochelin esterase family protein